MMWAERNLPSLQVAKWKAYTPIIAAKKRSRSSYCFHQSISNPHFHCSLVRRAPQKQAPRTKPRWFSEFPEWSLDGDVISDHHCSWEVNHPTYDTLPETNQHRCAPPQKKDASRGNFRKSSSPSNSNRGVATVSGKVKMFQKKTLQKIHTMTSKNAFLKGGLRSPCFYHWTLIPIPPHIRSSSSPGKTAPHGVMSSHGFFQMNSW